MPWGFCYRSSRISTWRSHVDFEWGDEHTSMSLVSFFMVSSFRGLRMGVLLDMPQLLDAKKSGGKEGGAASHVPRDENMNELSSAFALIPDIYPACLTSTSSLTICSISKKVFRVVPAHFVSRYSTRRSRSIPSFDPGQLPRRCPT
jgi:hypothetical protein